MSWPAPPTGSDQWLIGFLSIAKFRESLVLGPLLDALNSEGAFVPTGSKQPLSRVKEAYANDEDGLLEEKLFELDDAKVHLIVTGSSPATYSALKHKDKNNKPLTKPIVMA